MHGYRQFRDSSKLDELDVSAPGVRPISSLEQSLSSPENQEKTGAARVRLREACADDHARVDDIYSRFDLASRDGYIAFLSAQSCCLRPTEAALTAGGVGVIVPDWSDRQRAPLLAQDLHDLGAANNGVVDVPHLSGWPELLGALYVLEGSRFGGAVLSRRVFPSAPVRFLTAAAPPKGWRVLIDLLDQTLGSEADFIAAIAAAKAVFRSFEASANLILERVRV